MSPILRRARIAGDGSSPGSSPNDQGKTAGRPKVERNKYGCLTCRLRRKKCDQREFGEEPGPCHSCEEFRIECLGSGTKLPEWLKVEAEALRKEIKAHIKDKPDDELCFSDYYQKTSFRPHFAAPRAGNTSSSSDANSGGESPLIPHELRLDVSASLSPIAGTMPSPLSPYVGAPPLDVAFPAAGSDADKQQWLLERPHIVEAARTLPLSPFDFAQISQYLASHNGAMAAQLDEYLTYPPNEATLSVAGGVEITSSWPTGTGVGQEQRL